MKDWKALLSHSQKHVCCTFSIPNSFTLSFCSRILLSNKHAPASFKAFQKANYLEMQDDIELPLRVLSILLCYWAYLTKTQWFHWHFSHQTNIAQFMFLHFSNLLFLFMPMKIRVVRTKNSHLLISTVTLLWVKTFPVEHSKDVSVLHSIIVFCFS